VSKRLPICWVMSQNGWLNKCINQQHSMCRFMCINVQAYKHTISNHHTWMCGATSTGICWMTSVLMNIASMTWQPIRFHHMWMQACMANLLNDNKSMADNCKHMVDICNNCKPCMSNKYKHMAYHCKPMPNIHNGCSEMVNQSQYNV
jgi:hypothetical protein